MGLLDWLTEGVGSDMGGSSMKPPSAMDTTPSGAPPIAPAEPAMPSPPLPDGGDPMTAGGAPSNGPGLPEPPVPMPAPRPPEADASMAMNAWPTTRQFNADGSPAPMAMNVTPLVKSFNADGSPAAIPPAAAPASGSGMPPAPPLSLAPAAPPVGDGALGMNRGGFLQRALGLSDNRAASIKGALGAGLKSVGDNANKPGLAAFAGSLGSGIEGGKGAEDKTYDQKIKYLTAAVAAQSAGDKAEYNKNYALYLGAKIKNEREAADAKTTGKSSSWNKPDSQKFIDAQHALANDPEIKASQKLLEQTAKSGEPPDVAKAQAAHAALIKDKEGKYLAGVGLDPAMAVNLAQNPPGTPPVKGPDGKLVGGNPHIVTSRADFDNYVKPGQAYKNPADGQIYIRRKKGAAAEAAPGVPAAPSAAPVPPGPMPGPGAARPAAADDEE